MNTAEDFIRAFQIALTEAGLSPYMSWAVHDATLTDSGVRVEWKFWVIPTDGDSSAHVNGETYEECLAKAMALIPWISRELRGVSVGYDPVALGC